MEYYESSVPDTHVEYEDPNYEGLGFGRVELAGVMRRTYDELIAFAATPEFSEFHCELMALPSVQRPDFVRKVLFSPEELKRRNIAVPDGILIQTSAFGDRRPTLFALKKMMPDRYQLVWENMNLTFNNEFNEEDVSTSEENAWRPPLPVALQNALLSTGTSLESVPVEAGVKIGIYENQVA